MSLPIFAVAGQWAFPPHVSADQSTGPGFEDGGGVGGTTDTTRIRRTREAESSSWWCPRCKWRVGSRGSRRAERGSNLEMVREESRTGMGGENDMELLQVAG